MIRALLAVWLLVPGLLLGPRPAGASDGVVHTWEVDTGTTAVFVEDHRVPLVFMAIDFPAGTWSAWARGNGAEEAFEIQLHDSKGVLRSRADDLGMRLRLRMGARSSRLEATFENDRLDQALGLIRAVLRNRDFDTHELERWQKTRLLIWEEELRDPQFMLARACADTLFAPGDSRRLAWDVPSRVIDNSKTLLTVRDQLVGMPGRVIGLAGDLDREEAEKAVRGLLPSPAARRTAGLGPGLKPAPKKAGGRPGDEIVTMQRLNQVHLAMVRISLADDNAGWPALLISDHVLGGHEGSRLAEGLRRATGSAHGARTSNRGGEDEGGYSLKVYSGAAVSAAVERSLGEELRRFHAKGITEAERRAAAGFLRGRELFDRESPRQVMNTVLYELRRGWPRGHRRELVEAAAELPLQQINAFIGSFYDPADFAVVKVVPE